MFLHTPILQIPVSIIYGKWLTHNSIFVSNISSKGFLLFCRSRHYKYFHLALKG